MEACSSVECGEAFLRARLRSLRSSEIVLPDAGPVAHEDPDESQQWTRHEVGVGATRILRSRFAGRNKLDGGGQVDVVVSIGRVGRW